MCESRSVSVSWTCPWWGCRPAGRCSRGRPAPSRCSVLRSGAAAARGGAQRRLCRTLAGPPGSPQGEGPCLRVKPRFVCRVPGGPRRILPVRRSSVCVPVPFLGRELHPRGPGSPARGCPPHSFQRACPSRRLTDVAPAPVVVVRAWESSLWPRGTSARTCDRQPQPCLCLPCLPPPPPRPAPPVAPGSCRKDQGGHGASWQLDLGLPVGTDVSLLCRRPCGRHTGGTSGLCRCCFWLLAA